MSEKIVQLNEDGFREVLGAAEGMKEDKAAGSASSSGSVDAAWMAQSSSLATSACIRWEMADWER